MSKDPIVLILGDTPEARALAHSLHDAEIRGIYAHGGRKTLASPLPIPTRIGGFGGADGLARYISEARITHIVDATHPFTETMSQNARHAASQSNCPLLALTRPVWSAEAGDTWIHAPDMASAVAALETEPQRIFLAVGRQDVARFSKQPQHHYLLRLAQPPRTSPPLPNHELLIGDGPFNETSERALLEAQKIGLLVARNTGASGSRAKLDAARALELPVLMVDRPSLPKRPEVHAVDDVMAWLSDAQPVRRRN